MRPEARKYLWDAHTLVWGVIQGKLPALRVVLDEFLR